MDRETRMRRIWETIQDIPPGSVANYGQIAEIAGIPRGARQVGYALSSLEDGTSVPWQRVVNAKGEISPRTNGDGDIIQRLLLEEEGVIFNRNHRISLKRFRWTEGR